MAADAAPDAVQPSEKAGVPTHATMPPPAAAATLMAPPAIKQAVTANADTAGECERACTALPQFKQDDNTQILSADTARQAAMKAAAEAASAAAHLTPAQRERAINEAAALVRGCSALGNTNSPHPS